LCICDQVESFENKFFVLILQHPQEPDKELGSARIANLSLKNSKLKVGLSWSNLKKLIGEDANPAEWAVLYLGTKVNYQPVKTDSPKDEIIILNKNGNKHDNNDEILENLKGIIVLDGTWAQAKAMWWRNAWLLKVRRAVIFPSQKSLYGNLRKEPRRECVSTIEAIAVSLNALGEEPEIKQGLIGAFQKLIIKYKEELDRKKHANK
jgi:hypothetical protein